MDALRDDTALLDAIRSLTPEIASRAEEIEAARKVPEDLLDKLKAAGVFRMLLPRRYGGLEVDACEYMSVVEELAGADGSVGWTVMIGASFPMFWSRFPEEVQDRVFAAGPDVLARGALSPKGFATPTEGGYIVHGTWPLGSGCYKYDWVFVTCIVAEGGVPRATSSGLPEMRVVVLPAEEVTFLDTWHSLGLRATASDDLTIDHRFVPESHTVAATEGEVIFGQQDTGPILSRLSIFHLAGWHSALMTGLTGAILDDVAVVSRQRRPVMDPSIVMADDDSFRERVGELSIRLAAVRALQWSETAHVWQLAAEGRARSRMDRVKHRSVVAYVHRECLSIADEAFRLAGTSALYNGSSLQRRWRDLHSAGQHFVASTEAYRYLGALHCGADPAAFPGL